MSNEPQCVKQYDTNPNRGKRQQCEDCDEYYSEEYNENEDYEEEYDEDYGDDYEYEGEYDVDSESEEYGNEGTDSEDKPAILPASGN
jgi:hypothetical protein